MQFLVWIGAAITLLGIGGLVFVGLRLTAAKREITDESELRARIQKLVPINLAALFVAAFGLIMVIIGIALS